MLVNGRREIEDTLIAFYLRSLSYLFSLARERKERKRKERKETTSAFNTHATGLFFFLVLQNINFFIADYVDQLVMWIGM